MDHSIVPALQEAQLAVRMTQMLKSNTFTEQYGLSLSETQVKSLIAAEGESLRSCGRLEFGEGILPRLIYTFCDSPYINRTEYVEILDSLQMLFYTYKNELSDILTDDELLEAMYKLYHGKAQGSIEYLENIAMDDLLKVLRSDGAEEDEDA